MARTRTPAPPADVEGDAPESLSPRDRRIAKTRRAIVESAREPVSYTHLTLPTNREV